MTKNEVAAFLEKNGITNFVFEGTKFIGTSKVVIFTIDNVELRVTFKLSESLEQFKHSIEREYQETLLRADPQKILKFRGFQWK